MPTQQRRRLDQKRAPTRARQHLAERFQQDAIGRPQPRPTHLAPQHLQLMAKHQDLKLLRPVGTTKENKKLEQTADHPISERQNLKQQTSSTHLPTLLARSDLSQSSAPSAHARTGFWDPHAHLHGVISFVDGVSVTVRAWPPSAVGGMEMADLSTCG
jgi:hypothetical protein